MSVRILLVDDHGIVRDGLRSRFEKQSDMDIEVVGETGDGEQAVQLVQELVPDIVIMDVSMPKSNLSGIEATRQIISKFPKVKVVALSIHSEDVVVYKMIMAGALGYVLKENIFDELLKAIKAINDGHAYLSPEVTHVVIDIIMNGSIGKQPIDTLKERERAVIRGKWIGRTTKQIALDQHVSIKTIEGDGRKIFKVLDVESWPEVCDKALRAGIISQRKRPRCR